MAKTKTTPSLVKLAKCPTGISGLDEITGGGLPKGRPTLVCGSAGFGKTLFAMEFLVRGAHEYNEPGVFFAFEETADELAQNVASLGFDLKTLAVQKKIIVDQVRVERNEIEETGEYDLEALFIRLGYAIDSIHARRVVLDTIEALFAALPNEYILRAELRRLFRWLKDKGVTAIITAERGQGTLTRYGLEEYVSDAVILLDQRVGDQISTRRLRIVKYRGSSHGTNEYPFLIDEQGFSVLPVTSLGLHHTASRERITSGIPRLDALLDGGGYFRASTVLVSGTAGSGKSSIAANFADATCRRGERCLYFASEESPSQITANMSSIGLNLHEWVDHGLLRFIASRPTSFGLEMHLATMHKNIEQFKPGVVIIDPITNYTTVGSLGEIKTMLMRLVDYLKSQQITTLLTSLTGGGDNLEQTEVGISSLIDTWLLLRDVELSGERNRVLHILKSRGMAHSNQIREFLITSQGIELLDVYVGPGGVLTGSARLSQEARERAASLEREQEIAGKRLELERNHRSMEAKIALLQTEYEAEAQAINKLIAQELAREERLALDRNQMSRSRRADSESGNQKKRDNNGKETHS